jgi:uncharacterized membrane protein
MQTMQSPPASSAVQHGQPMRVPELMLIAGTRVMLGFGLGLLLSEQFSRDQRSTLGWSLFLTGIVATFPLISSVLSREAKPILPH